MANKQQADAGQTVLNTRCPFLLYANVPVVFIAAGFLVGTYALLDVSPSLPLLVLASAGAFLIYQVDRAFFPAPEDALNQPDRLDWVGRHRGWVWGASLTAGVVALVMIPLLKSGTLVLGVLLGLIGLLYVGPFFPHRRRLKAFGSWKPWVIGLAWVVGGVILPVVEAGGAVSGKVVALAVYRMLFLIPNVLLSDWPDRKGDALIGIRTPATWLPLQRLQQIAALSAMAALVGALFAIWFFEGPLLLYVDMAGPGLMLVMVLRTLPTSRWFYGFLIDAIVAWPAVTAIVWMLWY